MQELKSNKKFRPPNKVKDAASLNSLLGFLNDNRVTGAIVPKGEVVNAIPVESPGAEANKPTAVAATVEPTPKQALPQQPPAGPQTSAPVPSLTRVFLTGRFKTGKDYAAAQAGCKIFNAADPLYFLAEYFFGKQEKDKVRTFLQTVGQWGRGTVSAEYPLTPERAMFVKMVRTTLSTGAISSSDLYVDWKTYGSNENIWLDSLVARAKVEPAGTKIAISGVRFQNEYAKLLTEGFVPFHTICSPATWAERLKNAGLTPESPACKDISEQLAAGLDQSVTKQLSAQPKGAKLRCIWSDDKVACPSPRLLTISEFVTMFPK